MMTIMVQTGNYLVKFDWSGESKSWNWWKKKLESVKGTKQDQKPGARSSLQLGLSVFLYFVFLVFLYFFISVFLYSAQWKKQNRTQKSSAHLCSRVFQFGAWYGILWYPISDQSRGSSRILHFIPHCISSTDCICSHLTSVSDEPLLRS